MVAGLAAMSVHSWAVLMADWSDWWVETTVVLLVLTEETYWDYSMADEMEQQRAVQMAGNWGVEKAEEMDKKLAKKWVAELEYQREPWRERKKETS